MQGMLGRAKPFIIIVPEAALTYQQVSAIVIEVPTSFVTSLQAHVVVTTAVAQQVTLLTASVIVAPGLDVANVTFARTNVVLIAAPDTTGVTRMQMQIVVAPAADTLATTFFRTQIVVAASADTAGVTLAQTRIIVAPGADTSGVTFLRTNVLTVAASDVRAITYAQTLVVSCEQPDLKKITLLQASCVLTEQREPALIIVDQSSSPIDVIDGAASFYVVAELLDNDPIEIFYQWETRAPNAATFEQISGATNSTLDVVNLIGEDNNTEYRCRAYTVETTLLSAASVYSDAFRITLYRNSVTTLIADVLTCDPPIPVFDVSSFTLDIVTHIPPPVGQSISCITTDTLTFSGLSPTQRLTNLDLDILTRGSQNRVRLTTVAVDVLTYAEPPPPTVNQEISSIIVDALTLCELAPAQRLTTLNLEILTYSLPYI